ncbi:MAG: helix-turn-helix domain-containing protein [Bacteroidetes bacterium]|nr:helix-turn-helix domain-containing protein [Bacteroidota bacterium]
MDNKIIILTDEAFETLNEKLDMLILTRKDQQFAPARKWLNSNEVMQMLNISKSTLQIYRDKGIIPSHR